MSNPILIYQDRGKMTDIVSNFSRVPLERKHKGLEPLFKKTTGEGKEPRSPVSPKSKKLEEKREESLRVKNCLLSVLVFMGVLISNIKAKYIAYLAILVGAWIVHNRPFLTLFCGTIFLAGMLLVLTYTSWQKDLLNIGLAGTLGIILTISNPCLGWITLAYPAVLIRDAYDEHKVQLNKWWTREN